MKWVYILKCEDDYHYVGETSRLCNRFWQHNEGCGGLNTSIYRPECIVAIYKVNTLGKFFEYNEYVNKIIDGVWHEKYKGYKLRDFNAECEEHQYYDNLYAENNIAECLMIHNKDKWNKIRGGKYTRFDIEYKYPDNDYIKELPLCKCGLPCDIRKNEDKKYLFFRCAKKNMWDSLKEQFGIAEEPCNFFMEYSKDKKFRLEETTKFEDRSKILKELYKKSFWLKNIPECGKIEPEVCVGGCNKGYSYKKISFGYKERNLCYDCFIDKNEELSKKYNISEGKCLLKLK
jgi:predicted GIY-YIG superfamily endonuclease